MDEVVAGMLFLRIDFGGGSDFDRFEIFFTDLSFVELVPLLVEEVLDFGLPISANLLPCDD